MKRILIFIFPVIFIIALAILFLRVLKINNITCKNQETACSSNLQLSISNLRSKKENIFKTRSELANLLKKEPRVRDYSIQFVLPYNYQVNVIEESGIAAFVKPDGSFAIVNNKGEIIETVKETSLPKVTSYNNLTTSELMYIAELTSRLYTFGGSTSRVSSDGLEVQNINGKTVIFPLIGDQDVLLGSLTLILSRLPSVKEASTIKVIDLRYKNPVLR